MTVKELIAHFKTFDSNLECICRRYSDVQYFDESEIYITKAAPRQITRGY